MSDDKQSFFEKLTGSVVATDAPISPLSEDANPFPPAPEEQVGTDDADGDEKENEPETPEPDAPGTEMQNENKKEGHLTVDVYQTPTHVVVQAPMAGVKPDEVDVSINSDMITIRGIRGKKEETDSDDYYYREVFWGPFSRSILMPNEVDSNRTEASFKNGLLTVKMPKINKDGVQRVKIQTKEI